MNPSVITPDQCVFIDNNLKHFLCGVCGNLVQLFLYHDGGFGQDYCQRPYCRSCIDSYGVYPVKPGGYRNFTVPHCPVGNCDATFVHPKFRKPSRCDLAFYALIQVRCDKCHELYADPEVYCKHVSRCQGVVAAPSGTGRAAGVPHCSLSGIIFLEQLQRQGVKQFISFNCAMNNSKYIYGNIKKLPNNLVLRIFFENHLHRVQVDPGMTKEQFISKMKTFLGVEEELKFVFIKHRSLVSSGTLKGFMENLPVGSPVNLTTYRPNIADPSSYICLYKL